MPHFEERAEDWLSWEDALALGLDSVSPIPSRTVALTEAFGLSLAEGIVAPRTIPPGPTSAMDGYAVRSDDLATGGVETPLRVVGSTRPGDHPLSPLRRGQAVRVMTGGLLPPGADTVVPVERTDGEVDGSVHILEPPAAGMFVRPSGEEMRVGDPLAEAGDTLTAGLTALLASAGIRDVKVVPPPAVALIATGDELVALSDAPDGASEGSTFRVDVMSPTFPHLIRAAGGAPLEPRRASDSIESLRSAIEGAAEMADLILTTGGASMGEGDLVKRTLDELPFRLLFWRAKIRPGSPVGVGMLEVPGRSRPVAVVSLPGNPVSAFVTFLVLARPLLRRMGGHRRLHLPRTRATVREPLEGAEHLTHFFRVRLEPEGGGRWGARTSAPQGSGVIRSLALADGLAILPAHHGPLDEGSEVEVLLLDHPGWPE